MVDPKNALIIKKNDNLSTYSNFFCDTQIKMVIFLYN